MRTGIQFGLSDIINRLKKSEFVKLNLIFFVGSVVVGFFNYVYQLLAARLLGPADYSTVAAMLSLTYILFIPASPVMTVAMKYASTFQAKGRADQISGFLFKLSLYLFPSSTVIFLLLVILSSYIASFLNISSRVPVILIGLAVVFSFITPLNRGILQGLKRFLALSVNMGIEAFAKVALAAMLILLGFRANGAIFAIFLAGIIGYMASLIPLRDYLGRGSLDIHLRELASYSGAVLVAGLGMMVLMNVDILLVKHFFPAVQAGVYAAVSTMGKIIFFVTMPIAGVMFPMVSELHARNEKHHHVVNRSILMVVAISTAILLVYLVVPRLVIGILYGAKFLSATPYLLLLGVFGALLSLTGIFTNYFLSVGRKGFIPLILATGILMAGLIFAFHASLLQVITVIVLSLAVLVAILSLMYGRTFLQAQARGGPPPTY